MTKETDFKIITKQMKSFRKVMAVLSLVVLMAGFATAQTGAKFGYIDSN